MPRKAQAAAEAEADFPPPARTAPPAPDAGPFYAVSIRLQQGTIGGDAVVHWPRMAEAQVWKLLRDEVAFVRLPSAYETHPGGETKFLNRDQILEIHLYPAWPHDEPW